LKEINGEEMRNTKRGGRGGRGGAEGAESGRQKNYLKKALEEVDKEEEVAGKNNWKEMRKRS